MEERHTTLISKGNDIIPIPCKFYLLGNCTAGKSCKYLHIKQKQVINHPDELVKKEGLTCSYYLKGNCKFGSTCLFLHQKNNKGKKKSKNVAVDGQFIPTVSTSIPTVINTNGDDLRLDSDDIKGAISYGHEYSKRLASFPYPTFNLTNTHKRESNKAPLYSHILKSSLEHSYLPTNLSELSIKGLDDAPLPSSIIRPKSHTNYSICIDGGKLDELCSEAKLGLCTKNDRCFFIHGDKCPYCLLFILHPTNQEEKKSHLDSCKASSSPSSSVKSINEECSFNQEGLVECGICLQQLGVPFSPIIGLLNCNHSFCLECIRSWRASQSCDYSATRSCPICREVTYFITPSSIWTTDPMQKSEIIESYKKKLSNIPCKYFRQGNLSCPFGSSCFYAHLGRDRKPLDVPKVRICLNSMAEIQVLHEPRYCHNY